MTRLHLFIVSTLVFSLLLLHVAAVADESPKSANGLELTGWWTYNREVWISVRDRTPLYRKGTLDFVLTPERGETRSGRVKFGCGPDDQADRRLYLTKYKGQEAGQWATLKLTFKDSKGKSFFDVDLELE